MTTLSPTPSIGWHGLCSIPISKPKWRWCSSANVALARELSARPFAKSSASIRCIELTEHLTGRFNSHLRQCSFLFGDECYGPKDKSAEGTLKRIITEDTLTIEAKGRDAIEEPNCLHVMLASNNEWVIPAGAHERRFMVQRVADTHRQDAAWFAPIFQQMRSGGYQAMLFDLLERDLRDWHPRRIVHTAALAEQQDESLSPLDAWWLELLQSAVLAGSNSSAPDRAISNKYEDEVRDFDHFGGERTRTVKRDGLYDQARAVSPKLKGYTDAALGRYLRQQGCRNAWVQRHRGWGISTADRVPNALAGALPDDRLA